MNYKINLSSQTVNYTQYIRLAETVHGAVILDTANKDSLHNGCIYRAS